MKKMFDKILKFIENKLIPPLTKIGTQRHLVAIRNGLVITLPAIICGSIFLIIGNLPIDAWTDFLAPYQNLLDAATVASIGIISLLATIGISYNLSKNYNLDPISGAGLAVMAFLITQLDNEFALSTASFDSSGLFTAILAAFISVEIYRFCFKRNWIIKLPEGVPPAVSNSFMSLIPGFLILLLFWIVRVLLNFNVNEFVQQLLSPLVFALNSLPGILFYTFLVTLLWCGGIHGDMTLGGVADPILLQFVTANALAYAHHEPAKYITANGFSTLFVNVGGTGATLAIVILMLCSRSKTYRSLGKISLPGGIFEINEPVIFGLPIVMNPIMMIPFILVPLVLAASTYLLMFIGIVGKPITMVPWTMPPIIGPLMVTGWDWRAAIWSFIEIIIATAMYYPFFRIVEKDMMSKEKKAKIEKIS